MRLYSAVRERDFVVNVSLSSEQVKELNDGMKEVYQRFSSAFGAACALPVTEDCDEYAREEVYRVWEIFD